MSLNRLHALTPRGQPLENWLEIITILLHFHLPRNLPKHFKKPHVNFQVLLYLKDRSVCKWTDVQFAFQQL